MPITSNNVQNVRFLRNGTLYNTREAARTTLSGMQSSLTAEQDGSVILARYQETGADVKTLAGYVYVNGNTKTITIFDIDDAGGDVDEKIAALRAEINNELGTGITSANTATAQLAALSGNSSTDTSATTSVEGAKKYAKDYTDKQIGDLDYTGVTTGTGVYVTNVTEVDGVVAATTATLPTVGAISEAGKPITAVAEDKGTISASAGTIEAQYVNITDSGDKFTATTVEGALAEVKDAISGLDYSDSAIAKKFVIKVDETDGVIGTTKGSITSSAGTIVLSDNSDGGVNFDVNIDGVTILKNSETGELSVANSALIQYVGDDDTVQVSEAVAGVKTISSPLTIQKVTTGLSEEVKEEYRLIGHSGTTIGDPVKIYKDSHIVSITYITDTGDTHYQNLKYEYIDASGNTQTTYVDMSELVLEAEFASGLTIENHVARGVVDPSSEGFLTVGAGGFKLSGVQGAIDTAISGLDADVSGNSTHVTVGVEEVNGKITAVTVSESNIANADDLTNEIAARGNADTELSNRLGTGVTTANTATAQLAALVGTTADTKGSASIVGAKKYTDDKVATIIDGLDATVSGETADGKVNVKVTEENGVITAVDVVGTDIASASALTAVDNAMLSGVTAGNGISVSAKSDKSQTISAKVKNDGGIEVDGDGLHLGYIDAGVYDAE